MISPLPDWSWEVHGGEVLLAPPEGPHSGAIRYRERERPLTPVSQLIARELAEQGDESVTAVGAVEPVITGEGEYGALITIEGTRGGSLVQRTYGFVFADDYYARLTAVALRPEQFERFREIARGLVLGDLHMLGVRRRRFVYAPPAGWYGHVPLPLHAHWFPPEFPSDPRMLIAYPALPLVGGPGPMSLSVLRTGPTAPFMIDDAIAGPAPLGHDMLAGTQWQFVGRYPRGLQLVRSVGILSDDRYAYPLFCDARRHEPEAARLVLESTAASVQPIPRMGSDTGSNTPIPPDLIDHWL